MNFTEELVAARLDMPNLRYGQIIAAAIAYDRTIKGQTIQQLTFDTFYIEDARFAEIIHQFREMNKEAKSEA